MRVVVVGAKGQLGSEICRQLGSRGIPLTRAELDLATAAEIPAILRRHRPTAVINTAAYTKVDQAESEPDRCRQVNALCVGTLAAACQALRCPFVQISSDYVFGADTRRRTPYVEEDRTGPLSVYGQTKCEGEREAARAEWHLIVRTCGLYGLPHDPAHTNFVATMLRLARLRRPARVVDDQWCTPSFAPHVARAILELLGGEATGIWHVVNTGQTNWRDFAAEIFYRAGYSAEVTGISTAEYAALAPRPCYSVLDTTKLQHQLGRALPTWREALAEYFELSRR